MNEDEARRMLTRVTLIALGRQRQARVYAHPQSGAGTGPWGILIEWPGALLVLRSCREAVGYIQRWRAALPGDAA